MFTRVTFAREQDATRETRIALWLVGKGLRLCWRRLRHWRYKGLGAGVGRGRPERRAYGLVQRNLFARSAQREKGSVDTSPLAYERLQDPRWSATEPAPRLERLEAALEG